MNRQLIRQQIRKIRQQLSELEYKTASEQLAQRVIQSSLFKNSQHIACYMANDKEINLAPIIEKIWEEKKIGYLPILNPSQTGLLQFIPYQKDQLCKSNRFGIPEPVEHHQVIAPQKLDLILMPLVAFDIQGNRLGMGLGYYDKTLAILQKKSHSQKPYLVGLGYEFQKWPSLEPKSWDVPLDVIITDASIYEVQS